MQGECYHNFEVKHLWCI